MSIQSPEHAAPTVSLLDDLLKLLVDRQASDLHLKPMRPPLLRVNGKLDPIDAPPIDMATISQLLDPIIPKHLRSQLDKNLAIDFGYGVSGVSRFRASIFGQRGTRATAPCSIDTSSMYQPLLTLAKSEINKNPI